MPSNNPETNMNPTYNATTNNTESVPASTKDSPPSTTPSNTADKNPESGQSDHCCWVTNLCRCRFPQVTFLIGTAIYLALEFWPSTRFEGWLYSLGRVCTVFFTLFFIWIWALFFSKIRKSRSIIAALMVVALFFLGFDLELDGNMLPKVRLKEKIQNLLGIGHDQELQRERKKHNEIDKGSLDLLESLEDWPEFRGRGRQGIVHGINISTDWEKQPPRLVWKQLIGRGYSAFSVVNHILVTLEQRRFDGEDYECLVAYDAKTGLELRLHRWPGKFDEALGGPGPRSTPTIANGKIYALGAKGHLVCLDSKTWKELWSHDLLENNQNLQWGMSGSPLVYQDMVIVAPGAQTPESAGQEIRAYDCLTGELRWQSGTAATAYSSPMIANLQGCDQLLLFDAEAIRSFNPKDGKEWWSFPWKTMNGINVAQPILLGNNRLFIGAGYGMGGAILEIAGQIDSFQVNLVNKTAKTSMRCKFASPVFYQNHLYGLNDGVMECVDASTGKSCWKDDRRPRKGQAFGHGQILLLDSGYLLVTSEYGELILVKATPTEFQELGRIQAIDGTKSWNNPALVGSRIFIRNNNEMACFELNPEKD